MGLPVDDERIDAAAHIVDRRVTGELQLAAVGIDLDLANGATVREYRIVHFIVGHDSETTREIVGHLMALHFLGELKKIEAAVAAACNKAAVTEFDPIHRRCEDRSRRAPAFLDELNGRD